MPDPRTNPAAAEPPLLAGPAPAPESGDATGGVIPYKNPRALAAYYTGVFSVIPCVGLVLGCIALPLGISGLRQRKQRPVIRGAVHAWIGIILGSLSILAHLAVGLAMLLSSLARH